LFLTHFSANDHSLLSRQAHVEIGDRGSQRTSGLYRRRGHLRLPASACLGLRTCAAPPKLTIIFRSNDITDASTEVAVGQKIDLTGQIGGAGSVGPGLAMDVSPGTH